MNRERWFFVIVALAIIAAGVLGTLNQIALQNRVAKLEMAQNAPSILVVCQGANPVVTITTLHAATNLWFQLLSGEGKSALFAFYSQADFGVTDILDGGIGDMRGSGEYLKLSAGIYTLRGWSGIYTESQPIFRPRDLVFETTFVVPDCSK